MHRLLSLTCAALCAWTLAWLSPGGAEETRISGPFVHENLAVYLVHGPSRTGPVPLSLEEGLQRGLVSVHETGSVEELQIENNSDQELFVQAGDIVKGGQQDRVLTVSLLLPPRSGKLPIASFCVEQGRWAARGNENVKTFSSSSTSLPSREMKVAMRAPARAPERANEPGGPDRESPARAGEDRVQPDGRHTRVIRAGRDAAPSRQSMIWQGVEETQKKLKRSVGGEVRAKASESSLQLSLEDQKVRAAEARYIGALKQVGDRESDTIGYVIAINSKISSAEIYSSHGLFRKLWPKQLRAAAIEAISEKSTAAGEAVPNADGIRSFLKRAEGGASTERELLTENRLVSREGDGVLALETRRGGELVNFSYLAK